MNDFTLSLGGREFAPIMLGGMGVDISVTSLAQVIARLGGIANISDAMIPAVVDRHFGTSFVQEKRQQNKSYAGSPTQAGNAFDLDALYQAVHRYVSDTMSGKTGPGAIFMNVMEKLTMGQPRETLRTRLRAAMDAGIDGITLGAGLHLGSLDLISDHPRFRDTKLGIIVSSARALKLFLRRAARAERMPDYVVVEGPLAGGHLGFPLNWRDFDLKQIVTEVKQLLQEHAPHIPVIAAGGVFTGSDGVEMLEHGASGIQVATRFVIAQESGLPYDIKQRFFNAHEDDVVVNMVSPTGYPMRMLKDSPAIGAGVKPTCESFGYILDDEGKCPYLAAYHREEEASGQKPVSIPDVTCLCSNMLSYKVWTCGHYVYRLKDTTHRLANGDYQLPSAEHIFNDYLYSTNHQIALPEREEVELPQVLMA